MSVGARISGNEKETLHSCLRILELLLMTNLFTYINDNSNKERKLSIGYIMIKNLF